MDKKLFTVTDIIKFDVGEILKINILGPLLIEQSEDCRRITNWDYFQGSILAVVLSDSYQRSVLGSACIIAPGLAITATHVIMESLDSIQKGDVNLSCFGINSKSADYWRVTSVTYSPGSEITYLSIAMASVFEKGSSLWQFRLSTRTPQIGEFVTFIGFRFANFDPTNTVFAGDLLTSTGPVSAVYKRQRDKILINFPAIEVSCGAVGGMSGGALLDKFGCLLGITSTSFDSKDGFGPAYAAWIIGGLGVKVNIEWPRGLHQPNCHILDINPKLLEIEGRENLQRDSEKIFYLPKHLQHR